MVDVQKYDFSFTASSLRLGEMRLVAKHKIEGTEIDYVNEFGKGKSATGKRLLTEFNKRLQTLTINEIDLLIKGDLTTQKQIAFLSVCKTHIFIRDFAVEVLREKLLLFEYKISDGDYLSFYRRKNYLHLEMDDLTEVTQKKIKQVTFKILEQAGIIDSVKNRIIQPQILSEMLIKTISEDNIEWLKVFFLSDLDISKIRRQYERIS